mmetsp:Transcript_35692/g.68467  ORF Transcript_35692/g.68467 Transcript_35692/m.68467 type:complete len:322 (+) Transcript_35692:61-1026(+)
MAGEIQVSKLVTDARDGNLEEVRNALLRTYPAPPAEDDADQGGDEEDSSPSEEHLAVALWAACAQGHEHIAAELLQHGADLDYIDDTGFTALLWAVEASELGCVKLLIEAGADVNAHTETGATPLIMACDLSHPAQDMQIACALVEAGADVNKADSQGAAALSFAAEAAFAPTVAMLLEAGARVDAADEGKQTPLLRVAEYGRTTGEPDGPDAVKVAELLIAKGADVNAVDEEGDTPLILAVKQLSAGLVELLVSKGADVTTSNHAGETVASVVEAKRLSCFLPEEKAALEKIAAACKTTVSTKSEGVRLGADLARRKRRR